MGLFTEKETEFRQQQPLGRLAIELTPRWVASWGIDADPFAAPTAPRKLADADQ